MRRWFQMLVRTFPAHVRTQRGDEMLDALEATEFSRRQAVRESLSLIWASAVAWHVYSATQRAAREAAFVGALLWFGLLLGAGPGFRVRTLTEQSLGSPVDPIPLLLAISLFTLSLLVLRRSRLAAIALGVCAMLAAAVSGTMGSWGLIDSVLYEARWIGFALAAVIAASQPGLRQRSKVSIILPLAAAAIVIAMIGSIEMWATPRNYALAFRFRISEPAMQYIASSTWQWFFAVLFFTALALPFVIRALGAAIAPAAVHVTLLDVQAGLVAMLYVAVVLATHYLRQNLTINFRRKRQTP